jgi:hypothetical protein
MAEKSSEGAQRDETFFACLVRKIVISFALFRCLSLQLHLLTSKLLENIMIKLHSQPIYSSYSAVGKCLLVIPEG